MIITLIKCFLILKAKIKHPNMIRLDRGDFTFCEKDIIFWYNVPLGGNYTTKIERFRVSKCLKGIICND